MLFPVKLMQTFSALNVEVKEYRSIVTILLEFRRMAPEFNKGRNLALTLVWHIVSHMTI